MPKHDELGHADTRNTFLHNRSNVAGEPRSDLWRQGLLDYVELNVDATVLWRSIGPAPLNIESQVSWTNTDSTTTPDNAFQGVGPNSGEVTDIAIDASGTTDMNLYIATNDGGVWKTTDAGSTWIATMDGMPSLSMGAVAIDPSNPQTVYAGSGNPFDGGRAFTKGVGVFRSTDGGRSWAIVDGGVLDTVFAGRMVNRILVPAPSTLLVATDAGLFRSRDEGLNFGAFPNFSDRAPVLQGFITSLVADVRDASIIYAAVQGVGVYKSTDGGANFPANANLFLNFGAPPQPYGNLEIAQSEMSPQRLLVSVQYSNRTQSLYRGLFETIDGGANWRLHSYVDAASGDGFGQTDYDLTLAIDPQNDQLVYAGFQELWRSTDGGVQFESPSCTWEKVHWDHHALTLSPRTHRTGAPTTLYAGTDGGIAKSSDQGTTWNAINGAISSNLLFGIGIGRGAGNAYTYGGCQDAGTSVHRASDAGTTIWHLGIDGDGYAVAVDQADPRIVYGFDDSSLIKSIDEGVTYVTSNSSQAGVTPIGNGLPYLSDSFPDRSIALEQNGTDTANRVVYVGLDQQLCKSSNAADDFTVVYQLPSSTNPPATIRSLTTTTAHSGYLWVGSSDGSVHFSADGAGSWDQTAGFVTTPGSSAPVTAIAVDPANASRVAVAYAGQSGIDATHRTQHVYLTTDGGITWHDISGTDSKGPVGNLPDLPLHSVVFDVSVNPSAIIVAGDAGVMRCSNVQVTGATVTATWKIYGAGLPNVSCMSLAIDNSVMPPVLRVGTYGRGCFEVTRPSGPLLSVESSLGFGFARQGVTYTQPLYIYNSGDAALSVSAITRTAGLADFAIGSVALPASVPPGGTLTVAVVFTPSTVGDLAAIFEIASNDAHSPFVLPVSGTGIAGDSPRLATNPSQESGFGDTAVGTRRSIQLQMFNTGTADLHVTSVQLNGSSDFSLGSLASQPFTIMPGGEVDVAVTYQPSSRGAAKATVQIVSDDPRQTRGVEVSGWGV